MTTLDATIGPLVQQAPINFAASGDNTVIIGAVGKMIKVLQFFYVVAAATNLTFKSGSTPISGPLDFGSNAAQVQDFIQLPLTCNVGDSFIINSSAAVQVGGTIWYALVL
jgi:hypothetical protein